MAETADIADMADAAELEADLAEEEAEVSSETTREPNVTASVEPGSVEVDMMAGSTAVTGEPWLEVHGNEMR